ncbi:MAG: hypothetical protein KAV68_04255 [Dehalococcoidales bacterium]|nr:hypothetical protein [Dehalococcoidales bacterium]
MFYTCHYCGHLGTEATREDEHLYPASSGGTSTVSSCRPCNRQKGAKTQYAYAQWLLEHPEEMRPGVPYADSDRRPFVHRTLGVHV